ncbi:MAG: HD domain-containing protein [Chitinophagales bacterium]
MQTNVHIREPQSILQDAGATEQLLFRAVSECARTLGFPVYVVGGFVRDALLERNYKKDIDIVCIGDGIALAEKTAAYLPGKNNVSVFKNFGTAHFHFQGIDVEFVGARKESYRSDSRKPFVLAGTLQDDQNRRDLTINALAISLNATDMGSLLDPFHGLDDLRQGILRTPLEPELTFSDDPLRMLRTIRFATQLQFSIDKKTWHGIQSSAERIRIISQERITDELNKILHSEKPSIGLELLSTSGLLQIIFPELFALHGTEIIDGKGHKDNFYHTLEVLDNICATTDDLWLRWAAVLHDIAKPATKRFDEKLGWTFHGHEVVGARMVKKIFRKLKLPMHEEMRMVEKLVLLHLRPISLTKENVTDSAIRRLLFDAGEDLEKLMLLCNADITTKNRLKIKRYRENFDMVREKLRDVEARDHIRNFQPPITGEIIMQTFGLKPGKEVGTIKEFVREAILDGDISNDYTEAFALMLKKGSEMGLTRVHTK